MLNYLGKLGVKFLYFFDFALYKNSEKLWLEETSGENNGYTKYIILTTARSGSNWLAKLLSSHSNILSLAEVFHQEFIYHPMLSKDQKGSLIRLSARNKTPVKFLKHFVYKNYSSIHKAVGFKVFFEHLDRKENISLREYLIDNNEIKVIFLTRENQLSSCLSLLRARQTGQWIGPKGQVNKESPLDLSPVEAMNYFDGQESKRRRYKDYFKGHEILFVTYEQMYADINVVTSRILKFFELPGETLTSEFKKQSKLSLRNSVSNYEELAEYFKDGIYENFFDG